MNAKGKTVKLVFGADPGLDGAIACWAADPDVITVFIMPTLKVGGSKRELDASAVYRKLDMYRKLVGCPLQDIIFVLEKVSARPGQGVTSMFNFGQTYGGVKAVVRAMDIPLILVTPQAWKKVVLAGAKKDKNAAVRYAKDRYPSCSLLPTERCTKDHEGMAEALCIMDYGRRIYAG